MVLNHNWPNTNPDVHAVNLGGARGWREHAREDGDCGGLAGSVVAEEGGDLSLVEVQTQVFHGDLAVRVHLDGGRGRVISGTVG